MVLLYDLVMYNKWLGVESLVLYDDGSSVYLYSICFPYLSQLNPLLHNYDVQHQEKSHHGLQSLNHCNFWLQTCQPIPSDIPRYMQAVSSACVGAVTWTYMHLCTSHKCACYNIWPSASVWWAGGTS